MLHFISKLITPLLSPATWLLLLLAFYLVGKPVRYRKRAGATALIIFLVFSNPWLFFQTLQIWQPPPQPIGSSYTAVILPGGFSSYDKNGNGYFGQSADRFLQAAKLTQTGVAKNIIVTGGNGFLNRSLPPEALFAKQELMALGIAENRIQIETASRTTRENALFTKRLIDSLQWNGPFLLVTSAMHMRRCQLEFQNAQLITDAWMSNYEMINGFQRWYDWLWPDVGLLEKWSRLIKEMLGWVVSSW